MGVIIKQTFVAVEVCPMWPRVLLWLFEEVPNFLQPLYNAERNEEWLKWHRRQCKWFDVEVGLAMILPCKGTRPKASSVVTVNGNMLMSWNSVLHLTHHLLSHGEHRHLCLPPYICLHSCLLWAKSTVFWIWPQWQDPFYQNNGFNHASSAGYFGLLSPTVDTDRNSHFSLSVFMLDLLHIECQNTHSPNAVSFLVPCFRVRLCY